MHGGSADTLFVGEVGVVLIAALIAGLAARALRLPVLVGYLLAGIIVGPHTPGFVADEATVRSMADFGIVLLMFAVGVQFSLGELNHARKAALTVGGAMLGGSIALGMLLALTFGWGAQGGLLLGCALFLSSTAVMLRILDERGELGSKHGTVMLGVLVVQDLSFVLMAVLLPALGSMSQPGGIAWASIGAALLKAILFLLGTLLVATRVAPAVLDRLARTGSRELFLLGVICLCLLAAFAAEKMGLGAALGAFLAGIVIAESPYAHEVFAQVRPLRDVFSALFFVSVGMLLDPGFVVANWVPVLSVTLAILIGKPLATFGAMHMLGYQRRTSLKVALGLAQIGEFSFVLASMGAIGGELGETLGRVILSAALITLLLTPFVYDAAEPVYRLLSRGETPIVETENEPLGGEHGAERNDVIILGYGRVGRYVSNALRARNISHVVVDYSTDVLERLRGTEVQTVFGDVTAANVIAHLRPREARLAVVALPESVSSEMAVRLLKKEAPNLPVIVRLHRGIDIPRLRAAGADAVVHAEFEAGTEMIRQGLSHLDVGDIEIAAYIDLVRQDRYRRESEENGESEGVLEASAEPTGV